MKGGTRRGSHEGVGRVQRGVANQKGAWSVARVPGPALRNRPCATLSRPPSPVWWAARGAASEAGSSHHAPSHCLIQHACSQTDTLIGAPHTDTHRTPAALCTHPFPSFTLPFTVQAPPASLLPPQTQSGDTTEPDCRCGACMWPKLAHMRCIHPHTCSHVQSPCSHVHSQTYTLAH